MTRNRWLLVTVACSAVAGLGVMCAVTADHGDPARDTIGVAATGGPHDSGQSSTVTTTTLAPASSAPPYPVGVVRVNVVDASRGVPARGPTPESP